MAPTPHDALFKQVFSQPERAAEELRHVLARELAEQIDFATLTLAPGSFVDEELRERHTDLLFSAALAGTPIRIYVLFEHQSSVDPWLPLRLLSYMLRIWEAVRKAEPTAPRLPAIVPVVLHHSDTGWRAATCFEALIELPADAPAALLAHVPRFCFALDDLSGDEAIAARKVSVYTQLVLTALRDARRRTLMELLTSLRELMRWVERDPAAGVRAVWEVMRYLYEVHGAEEFETIDWAALDRDQEAMMQTIAQMLEERGLARGLERGRKEGRQEGRQEGRKEGRQEGRREGGQEVFLRFLGRRFGSLPESVVARVKAADEASLERWGDRLMSARSLDDVFVEP